MRQSKNTQKRNEQKATAEARMRWKKQPEKMYGIRSYVTTELNATDEH